MSKRGAEQSPSGGVSARGKRLCGASDASGAAGEAADAVDAERPPLEGPAFRLRESPAAEDTALASAPAFRAVHASWAAFDAALKAYSQATFQQYVIRTTTSVKRRNQRIAEVLAAAQPVVLQPAALQPAALQPADASAADAAERALIPERYEWYSKTLMCTHGWKNRHRGSGKRALASVRSTSCPARMCVTLQQRGAGDADWQVVVTKHARQHNHPLSKELFFYYLENRRIYDPELLAVGGDASVVSAALPRSVDPRELLSSEPVQQTPPLETGVPAMTVSAMAASANGPRADGIIAKMISEAVGGEFVRPEAAATLVRAPRASIKVHESWDAFNTYLAEYSESSNQVFRTRSTVSVAAKNAKTTERGDRAGRSSEEVATLLIPEGLKWYSKMLICCHGWKRKSRRKMLGSFYGTAGGPMFNGEDAEAASDARSACPATLLVRLERDASDTWRVVINRQVVEHNHALAVDAFDDDEAAAGIVRPSSHPAVMNAAETSGNRVDGRNAPSRGRQDELNQRLAAVSHDIVVRVPRLQNVFLSWEDFHENLKRYSDATYQLYCTRTTTSVTNRNRKIIAMKQQLAAEQGDSAGADAEADATAQSMSDTRLIPEEWKWYNKTLMCTHGWKRRPRGLGKRVAQVVRSTQCPVKICATLQYIETGSGASDANGNGEAGGWRVVVTKHIVDHNHNLSRALYEHYRENRRIYDPDLLTIDETNEAAVVMPKIPSVEVREAAVRAVYLPPTSSAEANEDETHRSASEAYPVGVGVGDGNSFLQVGAMPAPQSIPSMVILPFQPSISSGMPPSSNQRLAVSTSNSESKSTSVTTGNAVATLAALAAPQPQMFVPYHPPELVGNGGPIMVGGAIPIVGRPGFPGTSLQAGGAVFSLACPVHNGSGMVSSAGNGSGDVCACFRLAPGAPYITIAPSRPSPHMSGIPLASGFELPQVTNEHEYRELPATGDDERGDIDADGDADLEPLKGAWTPGSVVEIPPPVVNEPGETVWNVPPMAHRHATWDAFHSYLDEYSAATFQLFSVRTTTAVSSRNARIMQQIAQKSGSDASDPSSPDMAYQLRQLEATGQILPVKFEWYAKTFLCTHGWKRRRRGAGKRVGHSVRSTQCPAKICVTLQRSAYPAGQPGGAVKKWRVVVTKQELEHNHEISHAVYQKYSANRRVKDPEVMRAAERLWRSGSTRRQVFEFIKERAPQVPILMKDVHNIVQRWKKNPSKDGQDDGGGGEDSEGVGEVERAAAAEVMDDVADAHSG